MAMAAVVAPTAAREIAVIMAAVIPKSLFCLKRVIAWGVSTGTGTHLGMRAIMAKSNLAASQHCA